MGIIILIIIVGFIFLSLFNSYIFIEIKKHKKYYFYHISFGIGLKIKMIKIIFSVSKKDMAPKSLYYVKKKRRYKKIADLSRPGPIDTSLIKIIVKNLYFDDLNLKIDLGTDDAKNTALLCGNLQISAGSVFSILKTSGKIKKCALSVNPVFDKKFFNAYFFCIVKPRFANIITEILKEKFKKGGKKNEPGRKYNAGYNERDKKDCRC